MTTVTLPLKNIPGSYGIPFFSVIADRWDFYYNKGGNDGFFQDRMAKYDSTVFRTNLAPGPFMAKYNKGIVLVDAKSFPVLFDMSKVEKRDVFIGTYMPSLSYTGGFRICAYLDPSEPTHAKVKQMLFNLLASRKEYVVPAFHETFAKLFDQLEAEVAGSDRKSDFNKLTDRYAFEFLGRAFFGVAPDEGDKLPDKATKWLFFQLHPLMALGLPKFLEELLLHTFPLPQFLVKSDYEVLYNYFSSAAKPILDTATDKFGLSREEACHNLLFVTCFNSFGGFKIVFPGIFQFLAKTDREVHDRLATEVRGAVAADNSNGLVTIAALERMELVKSVVYEALRLDPPVKLQYGIAKQDLVIESHDAAYRVLKGEMLVGFQPIATRDERVFGPDAAQFVADRFVGEKGTELLKYLFWSNGREVDSPTVADKQCAGKDIVLLAGRLIVAEFFLRYDTFSADVGKLLLGPQVTFTSLTKTAGAE